MTINIGQSVSYAMSDGYLIGTVRDVVGEYAIVAYDQLQDLAKRPSPLRRIEVRPTLISHLTYAKKVWL